MKKSLAVGIVLVSVAVSACSYNTCPTYSKAPTKTLKGNRI